MPKCSLPLRLQPDEAWHGTDWDNPVQRKWKHYWFMYGFRCPKGTWYFPTLFAIPWAAIRVPFPIPIPAHWRMHPFVLAGKNITRWMSVKPMPSSDEVTEIKYYIPELKGKWLFFWQFRKARIVKAYRIDGKYLPATLDGVPFDLIDISYRANDNDGFIGPSTINYWENWATGLTWPLGWFFHWKWDKTKVDDVEVFINTPVRWDSGDGYYDLPNVIAGGCFK